MKQLLILFLLSISKFCTSQQATVQKTGVLKVRTAAGMTYYNETLFSVESKIKGRIGFSARLDKAKQAIKVKSFSKYGEAIAEKELAGGDNVFGPVEPALKVMNDSLFILYSRYTQDEKINIYAASLNTGNLETTGEHPVLSFPQKNININIFGTSFLFYSFVNATSPDGSKTVFFWCNGATTDFHYSVVNKNFEVIRTGNGTIAGLEKMIVENIFIDNEGGFYAGVTFMTHDGGAVIVCNPTEAAAVVPIALNNSIPGSVYISPKMENDVLHIAGLILTENLATGMYQGTVNIKSKTTGNITATSLPAAIIEKGHKEDYGIAKKSKYGLYPPVKMKGYTLPDGTIIIAGDLNRYISTVSSSENLKGPLLLGVLGKNGSPVIEYVTRRESLGFENYESNFYGHIYKGNLLLFYSDALKNLERPAAEAETVRHRGSAESSNAFLKINANGIVEKKIIDYKSQHGYIYNYQQIIPVNETVLFQGLSTRRFEYSDYKSEQSLVLITISE